MEVPDPHSEARRYGDPYSTHHPVPNIRGYKEQLHNRDKQSSVPGTPTAVEKTVEHTPPESPDDSYFPNSGDEETQHLAIDTDAGQKAQRKGPNSSTADNSAREPMSATALAKKNKEQVQEAEKQDKNESPKERSQGGTRVREVTDPVTHLPVNIHDFSSRELDEVESGEPLSKQQGNKNDEDEIKWTQARHDSLKVLIQDELQREQRDMQHSSSRSHPMVFLVLGIFISLAFEKIDVTTAIGNTIPEGYKYTASLVFKIVTTLVLGLVLSRLMSSKNGEGENVKQPQAQNQPNTLHKQQAETATWLNNLLSSVWPLVNPDLFISLADMLEDVMQASLPKLVKMIRVADIGQGSEPVRILGVRWLREGAAAEEKDGMKGEEGDFVNMELAIAYRAQPSKQTVSSKVKNAHLLLEFYLAGAIPFPVWVELKGMIGTCRVRLQTTPDPPFFSVMTFTFLGQPKVNISCVPLMKRMPNIMDVPLISSFVQSSIDAAMSEYVAPKSLTLDLKQTLMGDDFKTDVNGKGVLVIRVISAHDFKDGDGFKGTAGSVGKVIGMGGETGSDAYVALSWSKYGKSLWLTRIITKCQTPVWNETAVMIVGPDEINADERLQLTMWDSDRATADDHLGTIQVDLKDLLKESKDGNLTDRQDGFMKQNGEGKMPGNLKWQVGWFPKTKLTENQVQNSKASTEDQKNDPSQVERDVEDAAARKTREAGHRDEKDETAQQRDEDMKELADDIINTAPPLDDFPSGILSVQIHQITNLSLEKLSVDRDHHNEDTEQHEEGEDLPSAYCVITMNHRKVYKTRVKPKSSMPFFNAATERFIRDWRTAEVIVSVHDNRLHENNPILGCVVLPLHNVFKKSSQICHTYPLVGGLGYGRIRISLVFRSINYTIPRNLLGWEVGTLVIEPEIVGSNLPELLGHASRISISTKQRKSKLPRSKDQDGVWKREKQIYLPIKQRYASCTLFSFRKNRVGADSTTAFAVLWLQDIPDDEDCELELPVWDNDGDNIVRARQNMDTEYGNKLGTIKVKLKFWSGLDGYHKKLAKDDEHVAAVMEILDCASEGKELRDDVTSEYDDSSSSSSDSSSDEELEESGERGAIEDVKEYKKNRKELHRHHRGLMQWKVIRGANWAKDQVKDTAKDTVQKVTGRDAHDKEKNRIETEV